MARAIGRKAKRLVVWGFGAVAPPSRRSRSGFHLKLLHWSNFTCALVRRSMKGGVAQLGERLLCKQEVIGSIPFTSTRQMSEFR